MSKQDIIFVHGWGENHRIWEDMIKHLSGHNHHFIDLGFIKSQNESNPEIALRKLKTMPDDAYYVTHSLGTMWTVRHIMLHRISGLITINGFSNFNEFVDNNTLKIMANSLQRNIFLQMKMFWKNCNLPKNMQQIYKPALDGSVLSKGLDWLGSWNEYEKFQQLKAQSVPILSLGGDKDLILPFETMQAHWESLGINLVMKEDAGHSLPLSYPLWCAEQVKKLL